MDLMKYLARVRDSRPPKQSGITQLFPSGPAYSTEAETIAAIIAESTKAANDAGGRPLPLVATYNNATPFAWQIADIAAGYPVLPMKVWSREMTTAQFGATEFADSVIADGLPFTLAAGGFVFDGDFIDKTDYRALSDADTGEALLVRDVTAAVANGTTTATFTTSVSHLFWTGRPVTFSNMPGGWAALNGQTYTMSSVGGANFTISVDASIFGSYTSGGVATGRGYSVSPWGSATGWQTIGASWTNHTLSDWLETNYPNPPKVLHLANNETPRLAWHTSKQDQRYRAIYSDWSTRTEAQQMADTHFRLIDQWNVMFDAMRAGWNTEAWQNAMVTVGYNAFGHQRFQTAPYWFSFQVGGVVSSTIVADNLSYLAWEWRAWGGGSPEIYDNNWQGNGFWADAVTGSTTTIQFAATNRGSPSSMSTAELSGREYTVDFYDGTAWHSASVTDYDGTTRTATVDPPFPAAPQSGDPYGLTKYKRSFKSPFVMWCPQNEAMGEVFMRDIAYSLNPNYWYEISIWDGELWPEADGYIALENDSANNAKARRYRALGIDVSPDYYKGWTQYCLWITQPRSVREFRYHPSSASERYVDYWQKMLDQVAHIHSHPTLRRFWREGTLVENPTVITEYPTGFPRTHPFNHRNYTADGSLNGDVWHEYPKNYHLATNLDPTYDQPAPYEISVDADNIEWPIFTLAHVIGTTPNREWLVYAHSTGIGGNTLVNVEVTIPDHDTITLPTVPVQGAFYYVVE